jgi:threonylcarbamoyladenosine tRNA methylthiotransferase MtaB
MGRRYTTREYLEIVSEIRWFFPLAAMTTDVMVGFPGETPGEFQETLDFARKVGFYQIHVFKYSRRLGTKAAGFENQVGETVKNERSHILSELSRQLEGEFLQKNDGELAEVLFETINADGSYEGHTKNYLPVVLDTDEKINGRILEVRVSYKDRHSYRMTGEMIR